MPGVNDVAGIGLAVISGLADFRKIGRQVIVIIVVRLGL